MALHVLCKAGADGDFDTDMRASVSGYPNYQALYNGAISSNLVSIAP